MAGPDLPSLISHQREKILKARTKRDMHKNKNAFYHRRASMDLQYEQSILEVLESNQAAIECMKKLSTGATYQPKLNR